MIFVFYAINVVMLMLIRSWFIRKAVDVNSAISTLYAGLYLYPILAAFHAVFAGLICKYATITSLYPAFIKFKLTITIDGCFIYDNVTAQQFSYFDILNMKIIYITELFMTLGMIHGLLIRNR